MLFFKNTRRGHVCRRRPPARLQLEVLEDRLLPANGITPHPGAQLTGAPGVALTNVTVATFDVTSSTGAPGTKWNAEIIWGDNSSSSKRVAATAVSNSTFAFLGTHTYTQAGTFTITVMIAVPGSHIPNANTVDTTAVTSAPAATLQSIAVTPANPSIAKGQTQQFTATGKFSDNSTKNLTSQVTWASATASVATITAAGLATGVATGTSTISATLNGITGSTVLTVTAPALQSIAVTPANPNVAKGQTQQFTATATFSDNSTQNLTSQVTWASATPSVATITAAGLATGVATGTSTISAALNGITGSTVLTVTAVIPATQLVVTNLNPASVTAGGTVTFKVTAEDSSGLPVPGYTGIVQLSSTDKNALFNGSPLPANYTFVASDAGSHTFTVTLQTAGAKTITVTDQANSSLTATTSAFTVNAGSFSKYAVNVPGGNTLVAGAPFLFTVQATDQFGNPVTSYSGPASVTTNASPSDSQGSFPISGTLNGSGFGFFLGNLKTAGSYSLTTTAGSFSGSSATLTVNASTANFFTVAVPASATTGSSFNVTVMAKDPFGNIATGYSGHVHFSSSDGQAMLPADATLTSGQSTFSVTLKTAGSQTVTATDTVSTNPTITGTSSAITSRGLTVTSFTPLPDGFTAGFSKPFVSADVSLWGGTVAAPVRNVSLVGASRGAVNGSLIIDPTNTSITFKASAIDLATFFGSSILPNDTWHVTLVSGSGTNGFLDALGAGLDGANNTGHANYTTTFTTANDGKPALSIPDFARGPDGAHTIKVPNDSTSGIPGTLSNAAAVKDAVFTLSYNPTLLTPTGGGTADAPAGSTFTMGSITNVDATHAMVVFTFHNNTAQNGTVVLGDILANVPTSAANQYQGKELLGLGSITLNGAAFTGVAASGLHVNAYLGDVTGNGSITALDVATANTLAQGNPTSPIGLPAFRLVDPAIVGDIAADASIDATAVSDLAAFTSNLNPPQIPVLPTGLTITPGGPDPIVSLGEPLTQGDKVTRRQGGKVTNRGDSVTFSPGHLVTVPVFLDDPHPVGSTGMTEAVLALTYDPSVLSVSSADITLGSIPALGSGWQLSSVVDPTTGQIGIELYSLTAITAIQGGSLVTISFHVLPGALLPITAVQLVSRAMPNGQQFATQVDDGEGQFVLSPGMDRLVVQTGINPVRIRMSAFSQVRRGVSDAET